MLLFKKYITAQEPSYALGNIGEKYVDLGKVEYLGSLDKVKPNEKSLTKWLSKHNKQIVISEKLDGLSSLLVISLGKTDNSLQMQLYKHGDGFEGQDISHLLNHI
jgi:NAD-dependent DNA ligase